MGWFLWEGSSDVPLKQFITPVIWALAYKEHHPKSQLNIKILDLYSHLGQIEFHEKVIEFHQKILTNEEIKKWLKFYSFNKRDFSCVSSPFDILKKRKTRKRDSSGRNEDSTRVVEVLFARLLMLVSLGIVLIIN